MSPQMVPIVFAKALASFTLAPKSLPSASNFQLCHVYSQLFNAVIDWNCTYSEETTTWFLIPTLAKLFMSIYRKQHVINHSSSSRLEVMRFDLFHQPGTW
jgi:hypothetical protein